MATIVQSITYPTRTTTAMVADSSSMTQGD